MPPTISILAAADGATYGKIGTVPASAQLLVRCPITDKVRRVKWFVQCDKAHSLQTYLASGAINAATITVADATPLDNNDTFILNGVTFTAKDAGETLASHYFNSGGADETVTAASIVACINDPDHGVPGLLAAVNGSNARQIDLSIDEDVGRGATVIQFAQGTSGADEAAFASTTLSLLRPDGAAVARTAITTTKGLAFEQYVDGLCPYLGITNSDGADPATVIVEAVQFRA